jgi:hypothetical protein
MLAVTHRLVCACAVSGLPASPCSQAAAGVVTAVADTAVDVTKAVVTGGATAVTTVAGGVASVTKVSGQRARHGATLSQQHLTCRVCPSHARVPEAPRCAAPHAPVLVYTRD